MEKGLHREQENTVTFQGFAVRAPILGIGRRSGKDYAKLYLKNYRRGETGTKWEGLEFETFLAVYCWGRLRETAADVEAGDEIFVSGSLSTISWGIGGPGDKRKGYSVSILARTMVVVGKKGMRGVTAGPGVVTERVVGDEGEEG